MTRKDYLQKMLQIVAGNKPKKLQTAKPSKYPQGYFKAKKCKHCGSIFIPKAPSEHYCCDFCKDYGVTNAYYKRVYGLTLDDVLDMAENQNFVCAICHGDNFAMNDCHSGVLVVDHDHETGKVRGLVCHNCNRALGLLHDDVDNFRRAISYLERVTTIPEGSTVQADGAGSGGH